MEITEVGDYILWSKEKILNYNQLVAHLNTSEADFVIWDDCLFHSWHSLEQPRRITWPSADPFLMQQFDVGGRIAVKKNLFRTLNIDPSKQETTKNLFDSMRSNSYRIGRYERALRLVKSEHRSSFKLNNNLSSPQRISVICNYKDKPELMRDVIEDILKQSVKSELEVIFINNQSTKENKETVLLESKKLTEKAKVINLDFNKKFNKSQQDNMGASISTGDVLIFLNNDVRLISNNVLQRIADWAKTFPEYASMGPRIVGNNSRLVSSGTEIFKDQRLSSGYGIRESEEKIFSEVIHETTGNSFACAAMTRENYLSIGPFDEVEFPIQYNDADHMIRALRKGMNHLYIGDVVVFHEPGATEERTRAQVLSILERLVVKYPDMEKWWDVTPRSKPMDHVSLKKFGISEGVFKRVLRGVKRRISRILK